MDRLIRSRAEKSLRVEPWRTLGEDGGAEVGTN